MEGAATLLSSCNCDGESSGEKSRFHPSSFDFGFEGFFAALGLLVADGGEGMRYESKLAILREAIRAYLP